MMARAARPQPDLYCGGKRGWECGESERGKAGRAFNPLNVSFLLFFLFFLLSITYLALIRSTHTWAGMSKKTAAVVNGTGALPAPSNSNHSALSLALGLPRSTCRSLESGKEELGSVVSAISQEVLGV